MKMENNSECVHYVLRKEWVNNHVKHLRSKPSMETLNLTSRSKKGCPGGGLSAFLQN
jgi:hypothetical protein